MSYFKPLLLMAKSSTGGGGGASLTIGTPVLSSTGGIVMSAVPAGALLVLTTGSNTSSAAENCTVTSSPTLTWTKRVDAAGTNTGAAEIWTALFTAGGGITISLDWPTSGDKYSACYPVTGVETTLGGASGTQTNASAPSVSVTTTRANSVLFGITADWNGVDGASRTLRDSATESGYTHPSGSITAYTYYKVCTTAAAHTLGLSAPTGQVAATAIYEIRTP
jgi:hypothetical protein